MKKGLSYSTDICCRLPNKAIRQAAKETGYMILRKAIIVISFLASIHPASAQNVIIDRTRKDLEAARVDTSKVLLLCQLSFNFRNINIDTAIYFANAALSLARQIKFSRGEAHTMGDLAFHYSWKGELPKALQLALDALEIAEKHNLLIEKGNCLRRIGVVYYELGAYQKAVNYIRKAIACHQQIGDSLGVGIDYLSSTMAYLDMKNPDSSWNCIQKASEGINNAKDFEPEFHQWLGAVYWLKKNKDSALAAWTKGLETGNALQHYRPISRIFQLMATMYWDMNKSDSSIYYGKKALALAQKTSNLKTILLSSELLFKVYDSLQQPEALYYLKIAFAAKENLIGAGSVQAIDELIANDTKRQMAIEAEKTSYQNRFRQIMLGTGMGSVLIIAIILYYNNRKKQKTNLTLAKQKTEIQETLTQLKSTQSQLIQAEKMASLGELTAGIAHEIQNPLNFVNNFSEVNAELMQEMVHEFKSGNATDAFALAETIKQNIEKVNAHGKRADAIVKSMLQHSRTSSGKKESVDINAMADEYLRLSYQGLRARDGLFDAIITTDFDSNIGKINVIPQDISRVLVNLYHNAFYAAKEKALQSSNGFEPHVSVMTRKANGMVELTVRDNGNGIPENIRQKIFQPFFTTKPAGQGTGLGLSLSYDIVKAHGGEIKVSSEGGKGSQFTVNLPIV